MAADKDSMNIFVRLGILVFCLMGATLGHSEEVERPFLNFQQILKNPQSFSKHANKELVQKFSKFQKTIDEAWFRGGLQRRVRQLKQAHRPMSAEVLSEIVERSYEALLLKEEMENWVRQKGKSSPEGLGTLAHYFERVYVPLLRVRVEGRVFPEIGALNLQVAFVAGIYGSGDFERN
jgi:hypothetical protein